MADKQKSDLISLDTLKKFVHGFSSKKPSDDFLFHCEIIKNVLEGKNPPIFNQERDNLILPFNGYESVPPESTVVFINNFAMEEKKSRADVRK